MPKSILALMNVEGMTRENVASHLQASAARQACRALRRSWLLASQAVRCCCYADRCGCCVHHNTFMNTLLLLVAPELLLPVPCAPGRSTACTSAGWAG